jgi:hypothetical protein
MLQGCIIKVTELQNLIIDYVYHDEQSRNRKNSNHKTKFKIHITMPMISKIMILMNTNIKKNVLMHKLEN